jgi:HAD superfamily hydrolase (TIGR01549 family)
MRVLARTNSQAHAGARATVFRKMATGSTHSQFRRPRAVCFDIGETLVDETRHWSVIAAEAGIPLLTLFGVLGGTAARFEHHTRVFDILGVPNRSGPDYEEMDLYPDALPCLAELRRRGFRLGLAGNQPVSTEQFLRGLGVEVDVIASSGSWGVEKPSPDFFGRLAREFSLSPGEIAYVGDRIDNDVRPSRAAGMVAVHVRRGPWGYLQESAEAHLVLSSLSDLPTALEASR